jgi:hypothetical protein
MIGKAPRAATALGRFREDSPAIPDKPRSIMGKACGMSTELERRALDSGQGKHHAIAPKRSRRRRFLPIRPACRAPAHYLFDKIEYELGHVGTERLILSLLSSGLVSECVRGWGIRPADLRESVLAVLSGEML